MKKPFLNLNNLNTLRSLLQYFNLREMLSFKYFDGSYFKTNRVQYTDLLIAQTIIGFVVFAFQVRTL